jgi:hypothetical protein
MLRLGECEDCADVVLFLASDLARYITGVTLAVAGGQLLGPPACFGGLDEQEAHQIVSFSALAAEAKRCSRLHSLT